MANFEERQALQMTLKSLLDQRVAIRREYVDRDKELGQEIKQILFRIRELDERDNNPDYKDRDHESEETTDTRVVSEKLFSKSRRPYQHYDYPTIARAVETILEEAARPLSLTELYEELQKRQGADWSSPYIVIQKALVHSEKVKVGKEGRKLFFSIV